jgi:hydrogenase 3 maturation protease
MKKNLLITVGNRMMGDDAAGPLLAQRISDEPLTGWNVLDGGASPENYMHQVRQMAPERVVIVDAADMDLEPGEIRLLEAGELGNPFLMTTHTLPLSFLCQSLSEFVPSVQMIGIQPELVAFGYPTSISVKNAIESVYQGLKQGKLDWQVL